jgi:hypothetical protein
MPSSETQPSGNTVNPQQAATKKAQEPAPYIPVVPDATPAPECKKETHTRQPDATPGWKIVLETIAVFVGICVALIYAGQLNQMIKQTRIAQNSNRPFVGVSGIGIVHQRYDPTDKLWHGEMRPTPKTTYLTDTVTIKNFGPLPALNFKVHRSIYIDNVEEPSKGAPNVASTLNPSGEVLMEGFIGSNHYQDVIDGKSVMTLRIEFSYDGPEERYAECTIYRYRKEFGKCVYDGICVK